MEKWQPVPGYKGAYEVSNLGRVRSLDRLVQRPQPRVMKGQILSLRSGAYSNVSLSLEGVVTKHSVHRLVAAVFLGPCPDGMEVCHNNGDPKDNRVENLRYDTRKENMLDIVRHGRNQNAAKTHCPKGHPYSGENLRVGTHGYRYCRTCQAEHSRLRKARLRNGG